MEPGANSMNVGNGLGALAVPGTVIGMAARAAGQMMLLPWNLVTSMATGMARLAGGGQPAVSSGTTLTARPPAQAAAMGSEITTPATTFGKEARQMTTQMERYQCDVKPEKWEDCDKEYCKIRLFRYTIVTIQRGREHILYVSEQLVVDPMDECEFDSWVIGNYIREHPGVPARWLRVCSTCVCSWTKPSLHYEERQLRILERIARKVGDEDEDEYEYDYEVQEQVAAPARGRAAKGKAEKTA
jgi:hypothetical protein